MEASVVKVDVSRRQTGVGKRDFCGRLLTIGDDEELALCKRSWRSRDAADSAVGDAAPALRFDSAVSDSGRLHRCDMILLIEGLQEASPANLLKQQERMQQPKQSHGSSETVKLAREHRDKAIRFEIKEIPGHIKLKPNCRQATW